MKTPPNDENNVNNILITALRSFLPNDNNDLQKLLPLIPQILSKFNRIFSSHAVSQTCLYLVQNGAATAWLLQVQLGLPEATAYRALKRLRSLGLVVKVLRAPKHLSKGGPRPILWALNDATRDQIASALNLHFRSLSPKYRLAVEIAQTMLDNYIKPRQIHEVSYREILLYIENIRIPFMKPDIADLTAQYLHEQGVKVWR